VIHALAGEQDLRNMGGLKKVMPVTYITFFIGALALSGIPPFAGFFSKDEILLSAFQHGGMGKFLWVIGSITAFMTAFYIFRLVFSVFHGSPRAPDEVMKHAHESPRVMTLPLILLAFFSIITGWVGIHSENFNLIGPFLSSVLSGSDSEGAAVSGGGILVLSISILAGIGGIMLAYLFYYVNPNLPEILVQRFRGLYLLSFNKWYVDELYDFLFVRPTVRLAKGLWHYIDVTIIDNGCVNGVARAIQAWAANLRQIQSGQIQHYAIGMAFGALVIGLIYLVVYSGI
jgi:NADH-quinone oxidoreductase subunit L